MNFKMDKKIVPYLLGIIVTVIFGTTFIFIKTGLEYSSPIILLTYRFFIAFVVFTILIRIGLLKTNFKSKSIMPLLIISIINPVINFATEASALRYITTIEAGIFLSLVPIIVMILATLFLKEKSSFFQNIFILLSVLGVMICIASSTKLSNSSGFGITLILITATSIAIHGILTRKASLNYNANEITYCMICVGFVSFLSFALISNYNDLYNAFIIPLKYPQFIISTLYLAIGASIIAYLLFNYMYTQIPATSTSIYMNLVTVVVVFSGVFILNESLYFNQIIGSILIVIGVIGTNLIDYKKSKS